MSNHSGTRIVLVHPRGSNWIPGQPDVSSVANRMPPLGLLSLAAYLGNQGHAVSVYDCLGPGAGRTSEAVVRDLLSFAPDLVGFSSTTSSFPDTLNLASLLKRASPDVRIVVGGVHVSGTGPGVLETYPDIDLLVFGEGEMTLGELASGRAPADVPGLAFRDGGRIVSTPPRTQMPDLDTLPFPAFRGLKGFPRHYHLPLFSSPASPGATMVTSRGCPHACPFCDRSVFGKGYRFHGADYIYGQMEFLVRDFGVRHVNLYDDLFTFDRSRVTALCEALIARPLGVSFNCAVRIGEEDPELLALLRRAGAWMVSLGIESGDPALLRKHKPGQDLEQVTEAVARIRKAGLKVKGLFIAGLPGETPGTLARTAAFMRSLELDDMNLSKFAPFPGAPLWKRLANDPRFTNDPRLLNCLNFVYLPEGFQSLDDLEIAYAAAVKGFFTDPDWRRRFLGRAWACRHSFGVVLKHLPTFLRARRNFDPDDVAKARRKQA